MVFLTNVMFSVISLLNTHKSLTVMSPHCIVRIVSLSYLVCSVQDVKAECCNHENTNISNNLSDISFSSMAACDLIRVFLSIMNFQSVAHVDDSYINLDIYSDNRRKSTTGIPEYT